MWPQFEPIFDSYLLVLLVAAALGGMLLIGPRFARVKASRRVVLTSLRGLALLLLITAMLRPGCDTTVRKQQSAVLIVAVDQSRSMQLPHVTGETASRWLKQQQSLQAVAPLMASLDEKFEVKVYGYDSQLHPLTMEGGNLMLPAAPTGGETDVGSPLYEAIARERGKRLLGVLLMGDGAQTAFDPPVEIPVVERELTRQQVPLYAVPLGPPGDQAEAPDIAVVNFPDQRDVFVKNEMVIQGDVRIRHFVNKEIPVELLIEDDTGATTRLGPFPLMAREKDQLLPVSIPYTPTKPGQYKLTLRAPGQRGELVARNNELSAYLTVREGGLRVLYLEGELRWEQKFLKRSLDASQDIELDFLWIDSSDRTKWPVKLPQSATETPYDVYILGDLDASALHRGGAADSALQTIATQVAAGKGLLMLGGYHSFGPGGYLNTPLADALPVKIDRFERQDFDSPPQKDLHLAGPLTMQPASSHFLTRIAPDESNAAVWKSLPPLTGANRFTGIKPGARVLAASTEGDELLVSQQYGRGRVLAFAGDSTWQWWMQGKQAEHRRFWRQTILWLARRDGLEKDDVWVRINQRRFPAGGKAEFTAGVNDAAGAPISGATLQATVTGPSGSPQAVTLSSDGEIRQGEFKAARQPGNYTLQVVASKAGKELGRTAARFMVFDHDVELSNPAADHTRLRRLAAATADSGGKLISTSEMTDVLTQLRDTPLKVEAKTLKAWQLGRTALDAWVFFLIVAVVLIGEWALRKHWGLV